MAEEKGSDKHRLRASQKMKELMTLYYMGAKMAEGTEKKIAWITSGGPVEFLIAADIIPIYPENHGAMLGASKMSVELCEVAEGLGYSRDLCSYARGDIGSVADQKKPHPGRLAQARFPPGLQQHLRDGVEMVRGSEPDLSRCPFFSSTRPSSTTR